jgi:hypothetical protein
MSNLTKVTRADLLAKLASVCAHNPSQDLAHIVQTIDRFARSKRPRHLEYDPPLATDDEFYDTMTHSDYDWGVKGNRNGT